MDEQEAEAEEDTNPELVLAPKAEVRQKKWSDNDEFGHS